MADDATATCLARYRAQMRQRDQQQLFQTLVPPLRLTPANPYLETGVTPFQLAMRRKFDVLQYRRGGSVVAGQTAAQEWARLARMGSVVTRRLAPPLATHPAYTTCDVAHPMSVDRSGVPRGGDTDVLYLDLVTPQYQYEDPRLDRNYLAFADLVPPPFLVHYSTGAATRGPPHPAAWATVRFTASIAQPRYGLAVSVPLAITIAGVRKPENTNLQLATSVTVTVARTLALYYNDSPVLLVPGGSALLTLGLPTTTETTSSVPGGFSITQYLGALEAVLPNVLAQIDAIYTVRVQCTVSFSATTVFQWEISGGTVAANVATDMVPTTVTGDVPVTLTPVGTLPIPPGNVRLLLE